MVGIVALIYNWWSLFVRLADPTTIAGHVTASAMYAVARQSHHAGQTRIVISAMHAKAAPPREAHDRGLFSLHRRTAGEKSTPSRAGAVLSQRWSATSTVRPGRQGLDRFDLTVMPGLFVPAFGRDGAGFRIILNPAVGA